MSSFTGVECVTKPRIQRRFSPSRQDRDGPSKLLENASIWRFNLFAGRSSCAPPSLLLLVLESDTASSTNKMPASTPPTPSVTDARGGSCFGISIVFPFPTNSPNAFAFFASLSPSSLPAYIYTLCPTTQARRSLSTSKLNSRDCISSALGIVVPTAVSGRHWFDEASSSERRTHQGHSPNMDKPFPPRQHAAEDFDDDGQASSTERRSHQRHSTNKDKPSSSHQHTAEGFADDEQVSSKERSNHQRHSTTKDKPSSSHHYTAVEFDDDVRNAEEKPSSSHQHTAEGFADDEQVSSKERSNRQRHSTTKDKPSSSHHYSAEDFDDDEQVSSMERSIRQRHSTSKAKPTSTTSSHRRVTIRTDDDGRDEQALPKEGGARQRLLTNTRPEPEALESPHGLDTDQAAPRRLLTSARPEPEITEPPHALDSDKAAPSHQRPSAQSTEDGEPSSPQPFTRPIFPPGMHAYILCD
ncbi:uncharacterized protein MYCFIDRAFT_180283 [Pseudocercospora fijiensis CIRAD86]|uniref:Uncharacterized protein n=1 Tax=Pseudocercospora fijiensis (strain CIRAD86) TaxID=383855 RepID=M2ZDD8_PSEFD|nr:uncharacterized protein MYCFIDRAFT_180283 [Pseudocercospora fijiensis CIRAD86]EME77124.1 hypothetical protein MYCFIDRAFT_180283 [Pseudocercospora fijiensis CIRAD86]